MKNFIKTNWFKLIIVLVLIIVGYSAFYHYVVRPRQQEKALTECLEKAVKEGGAGGYISQKFALQSSTEELKEECFQRYPQE